MTEQEINELDARYEHLKKIEPIIKAENARMQQVLDVCTQLDAIGFKVVYDVEE
jgi:hypothetical protein